MPHSIRNDPRLFKDDVDIRFSRTLNSCKLPQIRIDFLNTFLLTYRVFTDSITVIEALKRVHYNPEMQLNAMSSSSLHDSSGSLDGETGLPKAAGQAANQGGAAGGNHGEGGSGSGGSGGGGAVGHHLHPSASPGHSHHHHHHHHGTLLNINMAGQSTGPVAGVSAANELVSTTIEYDYGRRVSTSSVLSDIAELGGEGGGGGVGGRGGGHHHHHHHRESLIAEVQQVSSREQQQAKEMQLFSASSPLIRNSQHWRLSYRKFEEEQARERYLKRMNNRQQHGSISSTSSSVMGGGGSVVGGVGGGGGGGPPNQLSQTQQQQVQQQQQEGNIFILPAGEPMLAPAITDPIAVPVPPPPSPEVPGYYQKEMAKREKEKQFQAAIGNDSCSGSGSGSDNSHDGSPTSTNSAEETTQLHYQQLQQQQQQQFWRRPGVQSSARGGASSSPASVSSAAAALQVPAHSQSMDTLTDGHGCSSLSSATSSATLVGSDSKSGSPRPSPVRKSPPNGSDFPTAAGSHSPFGQTASQQQQQQQMGNSRAAADEADMEDDGMEGEEQEEEEVGDDEEEEEYVEGRYKSTNPFATPIRRKSTSQQQQQQPIQSQLSEGTPPPTPPLPGTPPSRKHSTISTGTGHSATSQATPPPISSVGSCFVLPSKAHQQQQQPSAPVKSGGASVTPVRAVSPGAGRGRGHHPTAPSGRLSATSTTLTMNYLRVRGAGSKRGSGSSETESAAAGGGAGGGSGSTSVTPRSSFQTDTTGISTPRSSFQHPDSPQMSSKAGVVVTSSRATSRRSSTASAASAFAVATAASSNPPEPTDPLMRMQMMNMAGGGGAASRGSSRFSSATGADLKIPGAGGGGGGGGSLAGSISGPLGPRRRRTRRPRTAATMRVLNVLRHWVSKHSQDFENDERLLKVTTDFLEELVHNTNLLPAEHKAAVQLQQMIAKQTLDAKEKVDLDVLLAPPITPSRDNIETLSALEIAECMTFIDHNIFVRIQSEEFLGQAWMKDEKTVNAFHILLMTKHFNDVSRMVASEILRLPEIPKRVSVIEKWAAVADICRCLHNFNGVLQICAAFTNSSVFRLKRTWEKLNKTQTKQTIDKLQNLVSTDGRFRNMREALHRCDPPCIPYLGMYLTDLSFIEEGTPNFTDDGLLNFSKMRMIAHVIREIRHFQQTPYKIEHNPRVTNYLLDTSRHLGDEVLYQMSLCLEPRLSRLGSRATTVVNATSPSSAGTTFATATTTSQSHQ
ncbi:Ras protein-specific guanine nucleotide-releasing factor [Tyrophagus putrescentiae]|nr:Ras protein-specific guanine nucleotide-releasing factor [Tyrophagus putrescentiae]